MLNEAQIKNLNGGDLAFVGDSYYENVIRTHVLNKSITSLKKLHNECVRYVSRNAQNKIIMNLMDELTEEEQGIFKRGRNYNYTQKTAEYINASGFEAVIGYLYLLKNEERADYLITRSIEIIEV